MFLLFHIVAAYKTLSDGLVNGCGDVRFEVLRAPKSDSRLSYVQPKRADLFKSNLICEHVMRYRRTFSFFFVVDNLIVHNLGVVAMRKTQNQQKQLSLSFA